MLQSEAPTSRDVIVLTSDFALESLICNRLEVDVLFDVYSNSTYVRFSEGQTHYISLMRGNLQLRLGDAVYVLRDMLEDAITGNSPPRKVTYKTIKNVDYADLDIFRIERLWIDEK